MKKLGTQLIAELYGCDREIVSDVAAVERIMLQAAEVAGATVVGHSFHRFSPHGVSGVVVIQESHLAIHTWPEYGYCAVDIFTCGKLTDNGAALALIRQGLKAGHHTAVEMNRGLLDVCGEPARRSPPRE